MLTAVFTGAGGELTPTGYVDAAIPAVLTGPPWWARPRSLALLLPAGRLARPRATAAGADARAQEPAPIGA